MSKITHPKLAMAIFVVLFVGFVVTAIYYGNWFVPSKQTYVVGAALSIAITLAFFRRLWTIFNTESVGLWTFIKTESDYSGQGRTATVVLGLGMFILCFLFLWLFFAKTIPAAATRLTGSTHQSVAHVYYYYWASGSCHYELFIREFHPFLSSGFCHAGSDPGIYKKGQKVSVTYQETPMGQLILEFHDVR